ncbi:MAG: prepilin-type N-terminal cleavage/methylation domain-containing protein [Planctomycetota bacterium]
MNRQAFTLIELLVVISIIALLIGILMPVLGSARGAARTAICGTQQRQILTGFHNFSIDNKGYLPPGVMSLISSNPSIGQPWDDTIHEYIGGGTDNADLAGDTLPDNLEQEVLLCPSDKTAGDNANATRSYAMPGQDPSNPVAWAPLPPAGAGASVAMQSSSPNPTEDDLMYLHCLGMWITLDQSFWRRDQTSGQLGGLNVRGNFASVINLHRAELVSLDVDVIDPSGTFALCEYPRFGEDNSDGPNFAGVGTGSGFNNQSSGWYALLPGPAYLLKTDTVPQSHGGRDDNPSFNFGYADGHVKLRGAADTLGNDATLEDQFPLGAWSMRPGD